MSPLRGLRAFSRSTQCLRTGLTYAAPPGLGRGEEADADWDIVIEVLDQVTQGDVPEAGKDTLHPSGPAYPESERIADSAGRGEYLGEDIGWLGVRREIGVTGPSVGAGKPSGTLLLPCRGNIL